MIVLNKYKDKFDPKEVVNIMRGTLYGNPFPIGEQYKRGEAIAEYEKDLLNRILNKDPVTWLSLLKLKEDDKLVCCCKPKDCHGDVIIKYWKQFIQEVPYARPYTWDSVNYRSWHYAGIGSQKTPPEIQALMKELAQWLEGLGYTLHSGAADGADKAFESGCTQRKEIYLPWEGFNNNPSRLYPALDEAYPLAAALHPAWDWLKQGIRHLMARNGHQILGMDLKSPVDFVICWTPDGAETAEQRSAKTGGTGQAIALASYFGIPVFNLKNADALPRIKEYVERVLKVSAMEPKVTRDDIVTEDGKATVYRNILPPYNCGSVHFLQTLDALTPWEQETYNFSGKEVKAPRLTCWYGDEDYTYSGVAHKANPIPPYLYPLKDLVENYSRTEFNSVLLNNYRDGKDSIGYHRDDEPELGERPIIASVSFGAERTFQLKHNDGRTIDVPLGHGDLLIMSGELQKYWKHGIPKEPQILGPRINLTFRDTNGR